MSLPFPTIILFAALHIRYKIGVYSKTSTYGAGVLSLNFIGYQHFSNYYFPKKQITITLKTGGLPKQARRNLNSCTQVDFEVCGSSNFRLANGTTSLSSGAKTNTPTKVIVASESSALFSDFTRLILVVALAILFIFNILRRYDKRPNASRDAAK